MDRAYSYFGAWQICHLLIAHLLTATDPHGTLQVWTASTLVLGNVMLSGTQVNKQQQYNAWGLY